MKPVNIQHHLIGQSLVLLFGLCGLPAHGSNSAIDQSLQFNPGYVSPIARQANQVAVQAATMAREALNGEPAQIPGDWRLVNVVPKGNDYVMFFQDADGNVRSLRMAADGAISGQDVVLLKALP